MESQTIIKENPQNFKDPIKKYIWEINLRKNDLELVPKKSPRKIFCKYYKFYDLPDEYMGLLLLKVKNRIF